MKKFQKVAALLLTVSLASTSFLSGCSGNKGNEGDDAKKTEDTTPQRRGKITATIYDRGSVPAAEGTIENNRWTKWINENGPVDVEFTAVPRFDSAQKINILFASGSAPDLILEYDPGIKTPLYQQKQLMPIEDMIQKYSVGYKKLIEQYPELKKAGTMSDGKMYQFGRINSILPNRGVVIREDWLEKLKLEIPKTVDDYYKVAKAFAEQDPDGNGKKDTFGIALSYRAGETINQIFQTSSPWVVKNNDVNFGWDQMKAKLEFQKKLYDEGIVDREYLTDKNGAKATQDFVNGKIGIYPGMFTWRDFTVKEYTTLRKNVPEAKLAVIPYPETSFGRFNPTFSNPVQMTAVVNAQCKDPEAVMQYIDFISSMEYGLAITYGIEGEHYKMENGKAIIIDTEKHKNEVAYNGDFRMMVGTAAMTQYQSDTDNFDLNNPMEKEGYELYKNALKIYLDPNVPYAEITLSEHMPQMPSELATINANITLDDFYSKAIVSGSSYTVDQAIKDAQAAWEKGGGKQIEEWIKDWYKNEKSNAFLAQDIYEIMKKENKLGKLK